MTLVTGEIRWPLQTPKSTDLLTGHHLIIKDCFSEGGTSQYSETELILSYTFFWVTLGRGAPYRLTSLLIRERSLVNS